MRSRVVRNCVPACLLGLFFCIQTPSAIAKGDGNTISKTINVPSITDANSNDNNHAINIAPVSEFPWSGHSKLSWDDFKGPVNAVNPESAAATHCGIGFKTCTVNGRQEVIVYNAFYVNKSWVKPDAKIPGILTHEQGHFDLCEIYTRKLRNRLQGFDFNNTDVRSALEHIYLEVTNEYEQRQQAYESETIHGTDIPQQHKWCEIIASELAVSAGDMLPSPGV